MTPVGFEPHTREAGNTRLDANRVVADWSPHPARTLGLCLEEPDDEPLGRWLVACCLMAQRCPARRVAEVCAELERVDRAHPGQIQGRDAAALATALAAGEVPKPERVTALLVRASATLQEQHDGSLTRLGGRADDLEDLAHRLSRLAPGFGRTSVMRFLQPLRDVWPAAGELPLDPAARAAAEHLGWIGAGADTEGSPSALRTFLSADPQAPALWEVEFALAQLGRRSCLRERADRCPLGEACALRGETR